MILMLGVAVAVAAGPLHPLQLSVGSDRSYALALGGAAVTNGILNVALIPTVGMVGAALATLASQLQTATMLWVLVKKSSASSQTSGTRAMEQTE